MNKEIRSIWISDCHLGCRYSQSEKLLKFLKHKNPKYLYLVGDIFDGWKLRRRWYWNNTYNLIIRRILGMLKKGAKVYYITGNHDEFFRSILDFANDFGDVHFCDEIIHETVNGEKFLVIHGDKFDVVIRNIKWLCYIGDVGYELLLKLNSINSFFRSKFGLEYWSLSKSIRSKVKEASKFVSNFENVICAYAKKNGCKGVIAGHIHTPVIKNIDGIKYFNCGDWMENTTAIIEYEDGEIILFDQNEFDKLNQIGERIV